MPFYMSACDALLFTSMQEGSPNVVKEALACDLPVVSVAVGDVAERLHGIEGCELCADERPEALAAALGRVLRRGRRSAGREAIRQLDETVTTARVIAIYRSVLPAHPAPPRATESREVRAAAPERAVAASAARLPSAAGAPRLP
jgi:glycosyltransferase involved in cell wall biosynthesis